MRQLPSMTHLRVMATQNVSSILQLVISAYNCTIARTVYWTVFYTVWNRYVQYTRSRACRCKQKFGGPSQPTTNKRVTNYKELIFAHHSISYHCCCKTPRHCTAMMRTAPLIRRTIGVSLLLIALAIAHNNVPQSQSQQEHQQQHHHDCGQVDPTEQDINVSIQNEINFFGKPVQDITPSEQLDLVQNLQRGPFARKRGLLRGLQQTTTDSTSTPYRLVGVPIVYHVLANQDNGDQSGSPFATTDAQLTYMTNMTNRLFNIYDKTTKEYVQWVSFVHDSTILHTDIELNKDCKDLDDADIAMIVGNVTEWEQKMHAVICESNKFSGSASFPNMFPVTHARHNMVKIEYRAIACYDDEGNFLCNPTNNDDGQQQQVSHTRWWRVSN